MDDASGAVAAQRTRPSTPYYRRMARKEARVREDQYVALSRLVQVLTRRRVVRSGPRLTENTLIRVAIDLLLERADRLGGDTEAELRDSVLDAASATSGWAGPALFEFGDEPGTVPGR
jgi:hypothetical protein